MFSNPQQSNPGGLASAIQLWNMFSDRGGGNKPTSVVPNQNPNPSGNPYSGAGSGNAVNAANAVSGIGKICGAM